MASENVSKTVSLKDYIIDMQSAAVKGSAQYEVVLENNTDFIIKRRTATTDRELVILVSKGLYYIKDCKTGHIEELKEQSLNTFLRELKDGMVALHEVHWLSNLYRESVGLIMQVITDETLTDMCRHNVLVNTFDPTWYTRYWKQNSKLFIRLYNMFPSMADRKKYQASIPVIFWIEEQYGANEAMFFAEKLVQSGIMELDFNQNGYSYYERQTSHDPGWFLNVMTSPHRINLRRFIDPRISRLSMTLWRSRSIRPGCLPSARTLSSRMSLSRTWPTPEADTVLWSPLSRRNWRRKEST